MAGYKIGPIVGGNKFISKQNLFLQKYLHIKEMTFL